MGVGTSRTTRAPQEALLPHPEQGETAEVEGLAATAGGGGAVNGPDLRDRQGRAMWQQRKQAQWSRRRRILISGRRTACATSCWCGCFFRTVNGGLGLGVAWEGGGAQGAVFVSQLRFCMGGGEAVRLGTVGLCVVVVGATTDNAGVPAFPLSGYLLGFCIYL